MAQKAKQVLALALSLSLAMPAFGAECDTKDIKKNQDGTYTYSAPCHSRVGEVVEELDLRKEQVKRLNLSVDFYKQGYDIQSQRANDWMNTSIQLDKELQRQKTFSSFEKVGYFLLGVVVVGVAAQAVK